MQKLHTSNQCINLSETLTAFFFVKKNQHNKHLLKNMHCWFLKHNETISICTECFFSLWNGSGNHIEMFKLS